MFGRVYPCMWYNQTWIPGTHQVPHDGMSNGRFLQMKNPDNLRGMQKTCLTYLKLHVQSYRTQATVTDITLNLTNQ